jgi:hypothetical protein
MNPLHDWAQAWGIPPAALQDLMHRLAPVMLGAPTDEKLSEAGVTSQVRQEASSKGVLLFRNNVGALTDVEGRLIRYGLANDSPQMNKAYKSGDWIGIRPVTILPEHVGMVLGQFVSREVKRAGWRYTGKGREEAQMRWCAMVNARGGDAAMVTGTGSL